ncbi:glycine-rich domain-containing protein [Legionella tunisiensis]|uniref:hypothetical protein n=1 Tax=Legionella tunisiensis TaxID=1034944 RepID=UPI000474DCB6|nr:hypothetical protein [Legionella tunisiensis]
MRVPPLTELLTYKNEQVVRHFCHQYPDFSHEKSTQLFQDLLAWMWVNAYRQTNNRPTYLFGPLLMMDKMWHNFILHTQDYVNFCEHYFNDYFHHHVEPAGFEHHLTAEELADFLQDCFEYLGENWVLRYFKDAFDED